MCSGFTGFEGSKGVLRDDAFTLLEGHQTVYWNSLQHFPGTAEPLHLYPRHHPGLAQAEVQAQIAVRAETPSAPYFLNLTPVFRFHQDP